MKDERFTAKPPIHKHEEFAEHKWRRTKDREIDDFAMSFDYHNGSICERCGYTFCVLCEPDGWDKQPCVINEYRCPNCYRSLSKKDKFCSYYGQAIQWDGTRCLTDQEG